MAAGTGFGIIFLLIAITGSGIAADWMCLTGGVIGAAILILLTVKRNKQVL